MEKMQIVKKRKLSELADDVEVSVEETSTVYTVAELKQEIATGEPHHETSNWFTIHRKKWTPDARAMTENYIESEYDNMYEDWDERAQSCFTQEVIDQLQKVLDAAFKSDYATEYWSYEDRVEIDVFPPTSE